MDDTARLASIRIYPIKSLDGISLQSADVLPGGALRYDRRWALFDEAGRFVNGKRTARIHRLRASFDEALTHVRLRVDGETVEPTFDLRSDRRPLEAWLSAFLTFPVRVGEDTQTGFPDDQNASGPTIISTATLRTVAGWFSDVTLEECRRRFRANLELDGVEPFWEDRLFTVEGQARSFWIGDVELLGVNPCQRCVVPSRDSLSGEAVSGFQSHFARQRRAALPAWAEASRFDHFYRLAVNTRAKRQPARRLRIGDHVTLTQ